MSHHSQLIQVNIFHGALEYEVFVSEPGAIIEVGLVLPAGAAPSGYYLYGDTEDNPESHWYRYLPTQVLSNSVITTTTGQQIVRNFIKVTVQDGGPGDADKAADGKITIGPAAVAYPLSEPESGSLGFLLTSAFFLLLLLFRRPIFE